MKDGGQVDGYAQALIAAECFPGVMDLFKFALPTFGRKRQLNLPRQIESASYCYG